MPAPHHPHPGRAGGPSDDSGDAPAARSVIDIVNKLFARFDADGDGTITLSEWLGVVDAGHQADREAEFTALMARVDSNGDGQLGTAEASAALATLDSNSDGLLARSEVAAAHDAESTGVLPLLLHGGGPGPRGDSAGAAPIAVADAVAGLFDNIDSDLSDTLAVSELLAALDHHGRRDHAIDIESKVTAFVDAVDGNGDGSLSQAEVSAAVTLLDANQDGSVSAAEAGPGCGTGGQVELLGVLLHHLELPTG